MNCLKIELENSLEPRYLSAKYANSNMAGCLNKCRKMSDCEYGLLYAIGPNQVVCVLANQTLYGELSSPSDQTQTFCVKEEKEFQVFQKRRFF